MSFHEYQQLAGFEQRYRKIKKDLIQLTYINDNDFLKME